MKDFSLNVVDATSSKIRKITDKKKVDTLDLGLGQLPYKAPQALIDAGTQTFNEGLLQYTENAGLPELREAIANERNHLFNNSYTKQNVAVTSGAEHSLYTALGTLLNPGDEVLVPELSFQAYTEITKLFGAKVIAYPLNDSYKLIPSRFPDLITQKTKVIIINSPSNPTGSVMSHNELEQLSTVLKDTDVYIISDEVYSHLIFNGEQKAPSINSYYPKTIIVDSLSKRSAATGLRLGWLCGPEDFIQQAIKLIQYSITCASLPSQRAALAVVGNMSLLPNPYIQRLQTNKDILYKSLSGTPLVTYESDGAFYYFANISNFGKSLDISLRLLEKQNVLTIPGISFGIAGDSCIRISFATETSVLEESLKRIRTELGL